MNIVEYYTTTLTNAVIKIGPILLFAIGGYLIFIKLPFLFLKNSMKEQKKKFEEDPSVIRLDEKQKEKVDPLLKIAANQHQKKQESKTENKKQDFRQERKKEAPKQNQNSTNLLFAENIFNYRADEKFTKEDLKKRYHDLLRQNHPDRVASMGADFKKLAEQNTKDINKAYEKLKSKAS